jgi:branched-chain amino acid transport system ATP-binding protein
MTTLLEVSDLRAGYGSLAVVRGLSFSVKAGEVLALLGPNGAGKTTTALTVSSMLPPLGGTVQVLGSAPRGPRRAHLGIRSGLGIVLDDRGLFPALTVRQHLLIATSRRSAAAEIARVVTILPALERLFDRKAGLLSGGEQQMLAMARALVRRPQLLVVDEMSLGLAPLVAARLGSVVQQLAETEGVGVLLIEQHAELALSVADQVVVLEHGESAFAGSVAELSGTHLELLRASYLGRGDTTTEAAEAGS